MGPGFEDLVIVLEAISEMRAHEKLRPPGRLPCLSRQLSNRHLAIDIDVVDSRQEADHQRDHNWAGSSGHEVEDRLVLSSATVEAEGQQA